MQTTSQRIISDREWILTNGLGGYALGFGNMMNKRKYNGLLVSSTDKLERIHILSSLEERVERGSGFFFLDANHYLNCIYPEGYRHIVKSWLRPYPCTVYSALPYTEDVVVFKEMFLFDNQNAVAIKYSNVGLKHLCIVVRPKFTLRDHHAINPTGTWDRVHIEGEFSDEAFRIRRSDTGVLAFCYTKGGNLVEDRAVYRSVYYPMEALRGYDSVEDLIAPARIILNIPPKGSATVVFSSSHLDGPWDGASEAENRYKKLPLPVDHPDIVSPLVAKYDAKERIRQFDLSAYHRILEFAAQDFVLSNDDIIAGYPWFGAWGRDTLIALGGLKYLPQGPERAVKILEKYGSSLEGGVLPNIFGEGGRGGNYDSVDASLWYVIRCYEYGVNNEKLFSNICSVVLGFLFNEQNPFFVAEDGLIEIPQSEHALTWMDAKIYDYPVTPRWGKPVEINALWFNALCILREMALARRIKDLRSGEHSCDISILDATIEKIKNSFVKFIGPEYLADRLEGDAPVWEIRPNAVVALSLPFDLVDRGVMKNVWRTAKDKLLTSYGLRSLDPSHHAFKQKYIGNQKQRDLAYHQGTVWTYLLLPFARLAVKALGDEMPQGELMKEIARYVWTLRDGFFKAEMASVAEIWDGVDPYFPKGCPAQAWSVFALLEIEQMLLQNRSEEE